MYWTEKSEKLIIVNKNRKPETKLEKIHKPPKKTEKPNQTWPNSQTKNPNTPLLKKLLASY